MARFRKKPIEVEAVQWHGFAYGPHDLGIASLDPPGEGYGRGWIDTLESGHLVRPGDWIITGIRGERYPCNPEIFAATYEPVEDF